MLLELSYPSHPKRRALTLHVQIIFSVEKNMHLHLMSFLHIDMTQVVEILDQVRHGLTHSA